MTELKEFSATDFLIVTFPQLEELYLIFVDQSRYYLPTPPLEKDMTQGQFLSGV